MNGTAAPRVLSLGAGVQSSCLLLLSAEGRLPKLDAAAFADTRWESPEVYAHLDRLEKEVATPAGIPILRASVGDIRRDALDPTAHYGQMPLYIRGAGGGEGILRRACTPEYKMRALKQLMRELLGYPHPQRIPAGLYVEQWIGISLDEASRAVGMVNDVKYMRPEFPLLFLPGGAGPTHLGWTRTDCERYLASRGFASTPKSACIGCPYTSNARWRRMRDERPADWAEAVAFDEQIRHGYARAIASGKPLQGEAFLHRSRVPLAQAPIDRVSRSEWASRQTDIFETAADEETEERGCSPWVCRGEDEG
ncbi:hypothetical protein ABZ605_28320 [Streptomyces sp. NPDC012765]|uniref:hypothetical protein n=1 Tax=Streptomyces sp. NPDC012765 TaxID=3155249 RepID=UPI0033F8F65F